MWNFLRYLKYSNFKASVDLNPFVWGFKGTAQSPTRTDPHLWIFYWRILMLSLTVVIDDGIYLRDWIDDVQIQVDEIEQEVNDKL